MDIIIAPNPILRTPAAAVDVANTKALKSINKLAKQMTKVMRKHDGIGLAAPQVGESLQLIVIDLTDFESDKPERAVNEADKKLHYFINPQITELSEDKCTGGEGCLSFPGISVSIERAKAIKVEAFDIVGQPFSLEATKLFAIVLQHEIDHLNGITLFEHVAPKDKVAVLAAYSEALEAGARPGEVGEETAN